MLNLSLVENIGQKLKIIFTYLKFDPDETLQDSWEDSHKCMCKVSGKNMHWCWEIFIRMDKSRTDRGWMDG